MDFGIIPDDPEVIEHTLQQACLSCDAVIITGGLWTGALSLSWTQYCCLHHPFTSHRATCRFGCARFYDLERGGHHQFT